MAMGVAIGGAQGECVLEDGSFGSLAAAAWSSWDVRFTPESGRHTDASALCHVLKRRTVMD